MYTVLIVIIVLVSILMIGIVLIQESKGGGLASNFSSSNQIMGVRKTTDFIEKATWGLAIAMVVISIMCAYVAPKSTEDSSVMEQSATPTNTAIPAMPGQSAQGVPAGNAAKGGAAPATGGAPAGAPSAPQAPKTPAN
ncbi:MAG: preprotein translocase subunit SecG [Prevotella sp.]|jgi:preprotein translocase subunit SecG|uniref:Protein-export membrane protein SecG n=1 Tax=Segatella cerevisiae TaxID=2053716 RepID=A0ABT1BVZ6_9BACT|nr:preprotein translocase subunit SecG [Segatella cerevisiae]MCH3995631.1 preprotein translocase subunit SecG [Prevotella sp.]MCI1247272.1 preprotein translocase subunit SecG [Prevotella sp.]MCO6024985.1 preprotein translocase subunit SecG [Segatella cerevisiae]